jgi:hypothetical protein
MRCAFLEKRPQIIAYHLRLVAQSPVPNAFYCNAMTREESVALGIMLLLRRVAVLEAVCFNNQSRFGTVKVERVFSKRMLPTELVAGETLIAKHSPEQFFSP